MPRGQTRDPKKPEFYDWNHEAKDEHGNHRFPVGTRKHHVGREEHHAMHRSTSMYGKDRGEAHKKAAEAHAKVQTLKGKNLHPDHPLVHAAMAATKKAEAADHRHHQKKIQKGIETHQNMVKAAANPKHPDHENAKSHMKNFHDIRKAAASPDNHVKVHDPLSHRADKHGYIRLDHHYAKGSKESTPERYGDHLAKIKESVSNMKKEDIGHDDVGSFSHRRIATILRNPYHPHHAAAKAERDRRAMQRESKDEFEPHMMYDLKTGKGYMARKPADHHRMNKMGYSHDKPKTEGAMKRIATTQSNKTDRMASGGKKGLETFKKREIQKETKGAPKGYHFTRDGKLRKGDAGADGDGGAKLRSDPLDKQRSKIPPLPEKFANAAQQAAVMAKLKKSGKYDAKEGLYASNQTKRLMSPLQKARLDKEKADRDRDGKLMNVKTKPKMEGTVKSFSEISRSKLGSYAKAASKDIDKQRNTVKTALDQPASPMKAKAGMDAMKKLHKRSRGSDMYVNKMTGRSKVKPTAEAAVNEAGPRHTMTPMYKRFGGTVIPKKFDAYKKHMKTHKLDEPSVRMIHQNPDEPESKRMMKNPKYAKAVDMYKAAHKNESVEEAAVNELDKKTLGSYIKKAGPDAVKQTAQAKRHSDAGDMADKDRDMYKSYGKSQRAMDKAKNRQKGISKAVDKLTKEATIPDGQTAMTKRPELTNNDKDKLAKIRKMLDREKKK